ncbi:TetR/AcrR family transcriptional regulator [Cellulosimicrobium sp. NPDC055967]|uniref:TetR/AcrR family transcriptional regulator n=1 Tax=Cellulosimicrobium sp. NPDC055967 TaxID=3345670 RepID=UPI0035DF17D0
MPRIVDPVTRREEIVTAVLRLTAREGLARASLRKVADEAGLNVGSVRHYFASHEELVLFAMVSMVDRVSGRVRRHVADAQGWTARPSGERRRLVQALVEELLPLDDARRDEVSVFVEFTAAARTDPTLQEQARRAAEGTRWVLGQVLAGHVAGGGLRPGLDVETETARLWALVDGVATQAVLQPHLAGPATCRAVLDAHLRSLEADGYDDAPRAT